MTSRPEWNVRTSICSREKVKVPLNTRLQREVGKKQEMGNENCQNWEKIEENFSGKRLIHKIHKGNIGAKLEWTLNTEKKAAKRTENEQKIVRQDQRESPGCLRETETKESTIRPILIELIDIILFILLFFKDIF